ncbi:MAG TPA: hypothetical protein VIG73_05875 [Cerasibacillus sp.]|uniref:hypothetical protein n=1 Tax=Cerasibacillus sp. TaxID=2498711 RepID=UPI002F414D7A
MKLAKAHTVQGPLLESFIKTATSLDKGHLIKEGYVIQTNDCIKGCFILTQVSDEDYWLKQLFIHPEMTRNLPILLETIIMMTRELNGRKLYIHSHQVLLDIILDALYFEKTRDIPSALENIQKQSGKWWHYCTIS